ncbi:MAG: hypothetical protein C4521_00030 [Actinobacteria bacterium]|nr:MAG: hypothetical protein C4521_00030 [Actinomycetota bacterium]
MLVAGFGIMAILPPVLIALVALTWWRPELGSLVVVVAATNFLSLASNEALVLGPKVRLDDVMLLVVLTVWAMRMSLRRNPDVFRRTWLPKAVLLVIAAVGMELVFTPLRYGQSVPDTMSVARGFAYYALFFPVAAEMASRERRRVLVALVIACGVLFAMLYELQFIVGGSYKVFGGEIRTLMEHVGPITVPRVYVLGNLLSVLAFFLILARLFKPKTGRRVVLWIALGVSCGGFLLTFSRMLWLGVIAGAAVMFVYDRRIGLSRGVLRASLTAAAVAVASTFLAPGAADVLRERVLSVVVELSQGSGSYGYRLVEATSRLRIIAENILVGVGFVSEEQRALASAGALTSLRMPDSGLVTLLVYFGILGLVWLAALTLSFAHAAAAYRRQATVADTDMVGIVGFVSGMLITFVALNAFVAIEGIAVLALSLGVTHGIVTQRALASAVDSSG